MSRATVLYKFYRYMINVPPELAEEINTYLKNV